MAEQIADLKRGTEIVVATPGRMIDILTMQSGRILSLQRVSYIVLTKLIDVMIWGLHLKYLQSYQL